MDIYQHFRPEEHEQIDYLLDKVRQAETQYAPVLTYFFRSSWTIYVRSDSRQFQRFARFI